MPDLNKVMLMGNLTRDPEVRYTPKGTAVTELGLAINNSFRSQDGSTREEVTFVDIVVWGRQAETAKEYLTKGRPIFVEGRLQLDQWESKEGEKKSRLRVVADRVQFLGSRPGGGGGAGGGAGGGSYEKRERSAPSEPRGGEHGEQPPHREGPPAADEDDIPF